MAGRRPGSKNKPISTARLSEQGKRLFRDAQEVVARLVGKAKTEQDLGVLRDLAETAEKWTKAANAQAAQVKMLGGIGGEAAQEEKKLSGEELLQRMEQGG